MTELSFLVDLLLNHKLQKSTKDAIAERIKGLATTEVTIPFSHRPGISPQLAVSGQAPSTIAALQRQALEAHRQDEAIAIQGASQPVAVVAQTQATAAAMASRQQAIAESMSGKVNKDTGRPRKF